MAADARAGLEVAADPAAEVVRVAFVELMGAERRLRARDQKCKTGELTQGQIRALFTIDIKGEATAGELAKSAELSPASVSTMLDHLERDGIIERHRSETDRRVVVVTLTESGRALVTEKRDRFRARGREALAGLSDTDLTVGAEVMRRLAHMLDGL
jgi:DNA-binding MarR family transcriptional regulator